MGRGTLRYWAAARAAAGVAADDFDAATLSDALAAARAAHGPRFATVLERCSFLVDGEPVTTRDPATVSLPDGTVVEVLPPYAGG